MINIRKFRKASGFTLVEIVLSTGILAAFGGAAYYFFVNSIEMYAKNVSLNLTHSETRTAMRRVVREIELSAAMPRLISANGTALTGSKGWLINDTAQSTTKYADVSAPGIGLNVIRGGPYIITNSSGTGLTSTTTNITLTFSVNQPVPAVGDSFKVSEEGKSYYWVIKTCTVTGSTSTLKTISVVLENQIGTAMSWSSPDVKIATLVRPVAYMVALSAQTGANELRYYSPVTPIISNDVITGFTLPSTYQVLIRNLGVGVGDQKNISQSSLQTDHSLWAQSDAQPFSIYQSSISGGGNKYPLVNIVFRLRAKDYYRSSNDQFNAYTRVEASAAPKTESL